MARPRAPHARVPLSTSTGTRRWRLPRIDRWIAAGAAGGALAALLADALGVWLVLGWEAPLAVAIGALAGGVLAGIGAGAAVLMLDGVLFALYALIAFTPLASHWSKRWVRHDPPPASAPDAIVVLSSDVLPDSGLDAEATERLLAALELRRLYPGARLVTSRVRTGSRGREVVSDFDQERLVNLSGSREGWSIIDSVASTHDEAVGVRRLLGPATSIALVTSPSHTRRACAVFEKTGLRVRCVAARERSRATASPRSPGERLFAFRMYLYERAGMAWYRWKGWV